LFINGAGGKKNTSKIRSHAVVMPHAVLTREAYVALITYCAANCKRRLQNAALLLRVLEDKNFEETI
jgi:hypothetical protein